MNKITLALNLYLGLMVVLMASIIILTNYGG